MMYARARFRLAFLVERLVRDLDGIGRTAVAGILQIFEQIVRNDRYAAVSIVLVNGLGQSLVVVMINIRGRCAGSAASNAGMFLDPSVFSHVSMPPVNDTARF